MNCMVLRGVVLCVAAMTAYASGITVDATTNTQTFGTLKTGRGFTPPPVTAPVVDPTPTPPPPVVVALTPAPVPQTTPVPTNGNVITISTSYNSLLTGGGILYSLNGTVESLTGNSVALSGGTPLNLSGYSGQVGTKTVTGATLNLDLLIGAMTSSLVNADPTNPAYVPGLTGLIGDFGITISSGSVSKIVNATSVTAYDLFANGFGSQIAAGAPIVITFNGTDEVTTASNYTPVVLPSYPSAGRSFPVTQYIASVNELLAFTDARDLAATGALVLYTNPAAPQPLTDAPEPFSVLLTSGGIGLIAWLRLRKRSRQIRPSAR